MRERREEERKIMREGEAISPSRDEERRRKRERGEGEREKIGERERERMKREEGGLHEMKRERMKKDVDKTWQPGGGRESQTVHLSGNADVVPESGPKIKGHDLNKQICFSAVPLVRCP